MATRPDGHALVQFSKTPFPIVTALTTGDAWQIETPSRPGRYSGRGRPPNRVSWFHLARAVAGSPPAPDWEWRQNPDGTWQLRRPSTGESLKGRFTP